MARRDNDGLSAIGNGKTVDDEMVVRERLHRVFPFSSAPALSLGSIAPLCLYIQNSS